MQNPNQNPHPNLSIYPVSNPNPHPKSAPLTNSKSLTFDEVSKFFSLPLADAADSLGVCTSVLKKTCHENGLVRWPYRKFLLGKSIEEIKEDAAREKKKQLKVLKNAGRGSDDLSISNVASHPGSQLQNQTTISSQELSRSQPVMQLQGSKNLQMGSSQMLHASNITKGSQSNTDEFIYGFPSEGLPTASYRWWGKSSSNGNIDKPVDACDRASEDSHSIGSTTEGTKLQSKERESSIDSLETTGSLSSLRKQAVKEGRDALKLGVYRRCAANKLDPAKKLVLEQIFKSSQPGQWSDEPF